MSVCVYFKTEKQLEPKEIFKAVADKGEQIMVVSSEFPSLKFGRMYAALRGLEVNQEEEGFEIRICANASREDYRLYPVVIDVMNELTSIKAKNEDDEDINNPYEIFNDEWIDDQMKADRNVTCALIRSSGASITYNGMFSDFCLGFHIMNGFEVDIKNPDESKYNGLLEYLVSVQWMLKDKKDTSSRILIQNPNDKEETRSVSLISIKNNQLDKFDYISHASLFCIMNQDTGEVAIMPFEHLPKIVRSKSLKIFDEFSFFKDGRLMVNSVKEMMTLAKRYQPRDLFYRPTFPGSGYDKKQHTFILKWNPAISSVKMEDHLEGLRNIWVDDFNWSVYEWEKAEMGDRFYLVRVGEGNTGIVMSGVFSSQPYVLDDWSGRGRTVYYMEMKPNVIIDPDRAPMITTKELDEAIPDFTWNGGHSGHMLTDDQAMKLEKLFAKYFKKIEDKDDGETINVLHRF